MKRFVVLFFTLTLVGCASDEPKGLSPFSQQNLIPDSDYYSLTAAQTQNKKIYDGVTNQLDIFATLLNTTTALAQVDHTARMYEYNESQYQTEKGTVKANLGKQTEIFMSFYTPERKNDDLAHKVSKWKIFLDVGGKRYEPKIIKLKNVLAETQNLYPTHTRWATAYRLIFPVPTAVCDTNDAKLTITGPVAATELEFPAGKK